MAIILQIFLFVNVFIIGAVTAVAVRHAYEHYRHDKADPTTDGEQVVDSLPPDVRERLVKQTEAQFQKALDNSAVYLQHGLIGTATDLNNLVKNLVAQIIDSELVNYHKEMTAMRQRAETEMTAIKSGMDSHKQELRDQMAKEIAAEKQQLIKQIDTKLSDAVTSFLVEVLGSNVDLGSQKDYLVTQLELHKADFTKEVGDDNSKPVK